MLAVVRASRNAVYTSPMATKETLEPVFYVAFIEPVHLGFIPATSLPLLAFLVTLVGVLLALRIPSRVYAMLGEEATTGKLRQSIQAESKRKQ